MQYKNAYNNHELDSRSLKLSRGSCTWYKHKMSMIIPHAGGGWGRGEWGGGRGEWGGGRGEGEGEEWREGEGSGKEGRGGERRGKGVGGGRGNG
jgi:hypothetical protein